MGGHRREHNRFLNDAGSFMTSFSLFQEFGIENCKIELVEEYPCENLEKLLKKEGEYIKSIDCVNKVVAGRTCKEYYEDHKDKIQQNTKEYKQANKFKIKQYKKEWHEANKDKIQREKKEWYESNKDAINKKQRENYETNK